MSDGGVDSHTPAASSGEALLNLAAVRARVDSLRRFLADSVDRNAVLGRDQMGMVSSEIGLAIHEIVDNGTALLACALPRTPVPDPPPSPETPLGQRPGSAPARPDPAVAAKSESWVDDASSGGGVGDIVEIDAVELLAEHIHVCEICGKGFKRDANLRMHMRAHGNQFKTAEALAKPPQPPPPAREEGGKKHASSTLFSCPFRGCNRNRMHRKFRPLKSVICVKNHFKRSHCPKMYACNRCNKKHFSVLADLKSHLRHCGQSKWKCSCGTSFSRRDKLFGHLALFEGHMPAVVADVAADHKLAASSASAGREDDRQTIGSAAAKANWEGSDDGFFDGLLEEFGGVDGYCWQPVLGSPAGWSAGGSDSMDGFLDF